jgi:hypothetical protein
MACGASSLGYPCVLSVVYCVMSSKIGVQTVYSDNIGRVNRTSGLTRRSVSALSAGAYMQTTLLLMVGSERRIFV